MKREKSVLQPRDIAPVFFAADEVDTRCVQACYRILVGRARGYVVSPDSADNQTDYADGRLTWQFAMLLSLAEEHSLHVVDFEELDFELFVTDPRAAIAAQIQDNGAVDYQITHSDIDLEVDRARHCLKHPRIDLITRRPSYDDLRRISDRGAQVMCVINGGPLVGDDTYRPHSIVVRGVSEHVVMIDDPGPPPRPSWTLTRSEFERYWLDPTPNVANLIAVSDSPIDWLR